MITKEIGKVMEQETARVKSLTFHPSKPIVVSGHHSGVIKAWDYQMGVCVHDFLEHDGSVRAVLFHPRGDFFVSGGDDKVIRIWNYTERRVTNRLRGHDDFVRSLDFHPTKPWILSASDDQTIMVWNMLTGKLLATARGHCHYVMAARFLGESLIVSGSLDQSIRIWDCRGLAEGGKKSALLPDVVIKQIVDGHDRGVNAIAAGEGVFVSGGDDRDVKLWEWTETSAWERETMCNHQGSVTGLLCSGRYVVSCGEDGVFCIFDTEKRKGVERRVEGRYWCVAQKDSLYAAGHDSGFEVYLYAEPKLVCGVAGGFFYLRDSRILFSDYKTEKTVHKPKKDIVSMCAEGCRVVVQYTDRFEVLEDERMVVSEAGEAVLCGDSLVVRRGESVYRDAGGEREIVSSARGMLFGGMSEFVFMVNEKTVVLCFFKGGEKTLSVAFRPVWAVCSGDRIAVVGANDVCVYDMDLNLVNSVNEMVSITGGVFDGDVFVYATHKHVKYVFSDRGVLRSVDKMVVPFGVLEGRLYVLSDDGVECLEVDTTEIRFKKAVMDGEDIAPLIEGGALPGLAPLSYLIRQRKGAVALPYIADNRQRFELCLSDLQLDECLRYCREERDADMYRRLGDAAARSCNIGIAEECFRSTRQWNMLLMLYLCSGRSGQIEEIAREADEATRSTVMMYLGNAQYFRDCGLVDGVPQECSEESLEKAESSDEVQSEEQESEAKTESECNYSTIASRGSCSAEESHFEESADLAWSENGDEIDLGPLSLQEAVYPINDAALDGIDEPDEEIEDMMARGLALTTEGKFGKAIQVFKSGIAKIAFAIREGEDYGFCADERRKMGAYVAGLGVERSRRKMEDAGDNIAMAAYFASLPLEKEHRMLASSTAIMVLRKHGNLQQARELARALRDEGLSTKVSEKALGGADAENAHALPDGVFCCDVQGMRVESRECLLCFVRCAEGDLCANCRIGVLY